MWYRVTLPYAVFGIHVDRNDFIDDAAPIARWMIGKHLSFVEEWVDKKGGTLKETVVPWTPTIFPGEEG